MYTATANARMPTKPTLANVPCPIAPKPPRGHTAMVATANMYLPSGLERAFTRSMVSGRTTQRQLGPRKFLDALARHNRYPSRCLPSFSKGRILEIMDYLRIFRRYWWLIVVLTIVGGGAGYVTTLFLTPQYQSTTRM